MPAPEPRPGGLTDKQEAFVLAYIQNGGNASAAYREAYASRMTENALNVEAHRLLHKPKIALRLQVLRERSAAKAVLTRQWVLERLMRNADKALELEDLTASNKALELLGKVDELSMFVERSNVTSTNEHTHKLNPVSALDGFLAQEEGSRAESDPPPVVPN